MPELGENVTFRISFVFNAFALLIAAFAWSAPVAADVALPPGLSEPDTGISPSMAQHIRVLIAGKQFDSALKEMESLERQQPRNYAIYEVKGAIYFAKNDTGNARKNFERALALNPQSTRTAVQLADLDTVVGNPDAARKRMAEVLAREPGNTDAMIAMAGAAAAMGNDAEFVTWLEKAGKAAPGLERPRVLLVNYYLHKRQPGNAMTVARELLANDPDNLTGLDLLAAVQLASGYTAGAVSTYTRLVQTAPQDPQARYKLASAQFRAQDYNAARDELRRALALKPDFQEAKALLASTEIQSRHEDEALRIARQIQTESPGAGIGWQIEGDALMSQRKFADAQKAYEKAYAMQRSGALAVKLHGALSAAGRPTDADAVLLAWLKQAPQDAAARKYLAASYVRAGRNKDAIQQYATLLESDRNNPALLNDLAWLYQQDKDPRALATAEEALKRDPGNPDIMDTLGWLLVENGNTSRGLELLRKAAESAPNTSLIRYHYAAALAKSGDTERARRELESVLLKDPKFPQRADAEALLGQLRK
jgi:putative PEP-CTERM system TPR-repeat lipoprotein